MYIDRSRLQWLRSQDRADPVESSPEYQHPLHRVGRELQGPLRQLELQDQRKASELFI